MVDQGAVSDLFEFTAEKAPARTRDDVKAVEILELLSRVRGGSPETGAKAAALWIEHAITQILEE